MFLLPPMLWFYLKKQTDPSYSVDVKLMVLHLVPAIVVLLLLAPFYSLPGIEKLEWVYFYSHTELIRFSDVQSWTYTVVQPMTSISISLGLCYVFMSYKRLRAHEIKIKDQFSNTEDVSLVWLKYLVISAGACYALYMFVAVLNILSLNTSFLWAASVSVGCSLLCIFGYFGVTQKDIYAENSLTFPGRNNLVAEDVRPFEAGELEQKTKNSPLSERAQEEIYQQLKHYVTEHEPYLNPELTINQLAREASVPPRDLSRVINGKLGKNFLEFINEYRIQEAKKLLQGGKSGTVLDIAMAVGFNSKSAFYEAFKRVTNTTPTKYKKQTVGAAGEQLEKPVEGAV